MPPLRHAAAVASPTEPPIPPWAPDEQAAADFALIADAAPVPMWTSRPDGSRGFVNRAYCELVGLDYAAALGFDWRTLVHPEDAKRVAAEVGTGVASGATFGFEARMRAPDGEWRWLRTVTRPRTGADGRAIGYVGVAHDISEAKVAELELRAREHQLSALIDQTNAGLAQVDLSGRFTLVNDRFCSIVGRSRAQLMTLTMQELTHPDDLAFNLPLFEAAVRDGTPYALEKRYVRLDGGVVWVSNSVAVIRRPDGTPYGVLAVTLDITARRDAEAAVHENEARLAFLDRLARDTAAATDADAVLAITTRLLSEHLGVHGCSYADVEPDGDTFHTRGSWTQPPLPSLVGTYRLRAFGDPAFAALTAGESFAVTGLGDDRSLGMDGSNVAATLCMPFIRDGRLAGLMSVHSADPHAWTPAETAIVREVSDRSWAHVERVRAEAALRDSERRLRLALDGAKIGTWDYDLRTRRGSWSPRSAEIMGVPHDRQMTQREQADMVHPDDRARIAEGTARLATADRNDFAAEYRIVRPDGTVRWISSHGLIMRDDAGAPLRAIGTIRDVTVRREAQEALTALNQTLEQQVNDRTAERDRMWTTSPDLMLVIDGGGVLRRVNPAWTTLLGYAPEELVGHHVNEFVLPDDHPATIGAYEAAAGATLRMVNRYRHKDGSTRAISWVAAPADGVTYATGRDITAERQQQTELQEAQEALRQAQKVESLGQLTGGVAHDFNNLLTPIIGNLDLLARRAGEDERQARLVRGALESAERARTLVQRLLAFARRQPLQRRAVDLGALVQSMAPLIASTVGPQIKVDTEAPQGLPAAMADQNQLELAVLNLAVNARDAMPDGGRLHLVVGSADDKVLARAGLTGDFVALCIADTGTGMDAETAARAVEPFFSTKGVGRGTGLGLSMVHGLASQLGGAMLLTTALGEGTRVELLLPIAPYAEEVAAAPSGRSPAGEGRVLLVDDEEAVRDATAEMLVSLGYSVTTAASGEEALTLLADDPDYLITDHMMPGMNGADLARTARERRPALKVLVVSGYAALDEIPPELPRLAKPFRLDELAAHIGALP